MYKHKHSRDMRLLLILCQSLRGKINKSSEELSNWWIEYIPKHDEINSVISGGAAQTELLEHRFN